MARITDRLIPTQTPAPVSKPESSVEVFLDAIRLAFNATEDEEARHLDTIIERLRETPNSFEIAVRLYETHPTDSGFRWAVLYIASKVAAAGTARWLTRIALEEVPAARHDEGTCESTRDAEVLVRIMATEGLALLGDAELPNLIEDALMSIVVAQDDPTIRSAAVVQLLEINPENAARIREALPSHLRHLADVELLLHPSDVDQPFSVIGFDAGESVLPPSDERGK